MAVRFKHRIVSIHRFANGNGRHSRLMADIIIEKIYKLPVFTWGAANLSSEGDARAAYLQAVKAADKGDYSLLIAFARSRQLFSFNLLSLHWRNFYLFNSFTQFLFFNGAVIPIILTTFPWRFLYSFCFAVFHF